MIVYSFLIYCTSGFLIESSHSFLYSILAVASAAEKKLAVNVNNNNKVVVVVVICCLESLMKDTSVCSSCV